MRLLIASILCFFTSTVNAADLSFSWKPNTDTTTGYQLVVDGGSNTILDIPGRESHMASVTVADECQTFALLAYNAGGATSPLSEFVLWCPDAPRAVGKFVITIEEVYL